MSQKLAPIDWRTLVKVFEAEGFKRDRQHGSHIAMVKPGIARPIVIQQGMDVPVFIIKTNLRTADIKSRTILRDPQYAVAAESQG